MQKKSCSFTVLCNGDKKQITACAGENLLKVLLDNNYYVSSPCMGKGTCKKCEVLVDGEKVLSCKAKVTDSITVEVEVGIENKIYSDSAIEQTGEYIPDGAFVLDIGTTTLALALVSSNSSVAEVITANNPQIKYGADVISRIENCAHGKQSEMQRAVVDAINGMIGYFKEKYNATNAKLFVAGNMTMLHLLLGADCTQMGVAPYTPGFLSSQIINAKKIGIETAADIITLPGIHTFVGADIAAGISILPEPTAGEFNILVDLGTNAEIALITENKILCTSAAAGPCFEGGNISCGMSAVDGAIRSFKIENGFCKYKTIGNSKPKGICGTGLIDAVAQMTVNNIIDKTGLLLNGEAFDLCDTVALTQKDIREFQLAKSAVSSAIKTLISASGTDIKRLGALYISGGFSSYIDIESAAVSGIIPKECADKCVTLGNSSLAGAIKFAEQSTRIKAVTEKAEYIDLSGSEMFADLFMKNMYFN